MHVIVGATGNVGSAVVKELLARKEKVLTITHNPKHVAKLRLAGAEVAIVDVSNTLELAEVFQKGSSLFLLNPPADVSIDSNKTEKDTVRSLIAAVSRAENIKKIVAQSTQGAQPGDSLGDLSVLYELEKGLKSLNRPTRITRAAYYMTNWNVQDESVQESGVLQSFFPKDLKLAMVAPTDLGVFNANQLLQDFTGFSIQDVSGPAEYSAADVASQYSRIYGRKIAVSVIPRKEWVQSFLNLGFSNSSAESYARMTAIVVDENYQTSPRPYRMPTSLQDYFDQKIKNTQPLQHVMKPLEL